MTVRVSKPEFNLREKLSELDKPTGLHGNEILKSETPQDTFDLVGTGRKNMVVNGDMRISQRYGTSENTPENNKLTLDQMRYDVSQGSKLKVQQVTDAPAGFSHSMKVTSLAATSPGVNDYFLLQNFIEGNNTERLGWGTSDAQTVTLSFYVKSSITGTHACGIRNKDYNRGNTQTYTINNANTWEKKTVTFPGDTTGTWETGIEAGLKINFDLGSGSNFQAASTGTWLATNDFITSDSVKVIGTNAATWYITGIQLETGKLATPFEHRSFAEELALCQRYFFRLKAASNYSAYGIGGAYSSTQAVVLIYFPVPMRALPIFTKAGNDSIYYDKVGGGSNFTNFSITQHMGTTTTGVTHLELLVLGSFTAGNPFVLSSLNNTSTHFNFDAEIPST